MDNEKETFVKGYKFMWKYLAINFLVGIIILLGFVLLVIPGIIFSIWFIFSTFLVIDGKKGYKAALVKSKQMVKGRFWPILGRVVVFNLLAVLASMIIGILPYAGSLIVSFLAPLFLLPTYLMYGDLLKQQDKDLLNANS